MKVRIQRRKTLGKEIASGSIYLLLICGAPQIDDINESFSH